MVHLAVQQMQPPHNQLVTADELAAAAAAPALAALTLCGCRLSEPVSAPLVERLRGARAAAAAAEGAGEADAARAGGDEGRGERRREFGGGGGGAGLRVAVLPWSSVQQPSLLGAWEGEEGGRSAVARAFM
jgi:hypothetical protein